MAVIYLRSTTGSDANDGSTWALAKATMAAAVTAAGNSGTVYVSKNHNESNAAAKVISASVGIDTPTSVICVDDTGSPEPPTTLATTAIVECTGNFDMNIKGQIYVYGVKFKVGSGSSALRLLAFSNDVEQYYGVFENCEFHMLSTGDTSVLQLGANVTGIKRNKTTWINCNVVLNTTGQVIQLRGTLVWKGGVLTCNASPQVVAINNSATYALAYVEGVDFSGLASGSQVSAASGGARFVFKNCKIPVGVLLNPNAFTQGGEATFIGVSSGNTPYQYDRATVFGHITNEMTIVRTGGASYNGTAFSYKMLTSTTNAAPLYFKPLESPFITKWNTTVGTPITVSIPILTDNVTLTNLEAWLEASYLGNSGNVLGVIASGRLANFLGSPTNQPLDTNSTWVTTGIGTPVKQLLSLTFTPQSVGVIAIKVMIAKLTTTVYIDPVLQVS